MKAILASPTRNAAERASLIHREIFQLAVLIAVAVAAFVVTRAVAVSNRNLSLQDGAEWYQRGQHALQAGRVNDATDAFRRAAVRNRDDKRYALALARALTIKGDDAAARAALLALRESAPDDAEINLQLARLAAERHDVTEALRYYHNALYAPWPVEQTDVRRQVRFELIRFLLTHDQNRRALSELLALSTDLPDDAGLHTTVGQLFAQAGDSGHALNQFQAALRPGRDRSDALAGAGLAAFQLGDYPLAGRYLRSVQINTENVKATRELVELILANDPLARRIGATARGQRLTANFSYAKQRLDSCLEQRTHTQPTGDGLALQREAEPFAAQLHSPAIREQDTIEAGVDLIARIERNVAQACPPQSPFDRALILIGRQHGADDR